MKARGRDDDQPRARTKGDGAADRDRPRVKQVAAGSSGGHAGDADAVRSEQAEPPVEATKGISEEAIGGLLKEAAGLLKSLHAPSLKSIAVVGSEVVKVSALGARDRRALLDGGATHCLRQVKDLGEWNAAVEVEVELAQGTTRLRQVPMTRTLVTEQSIQPLVPLGLLAEIGYAVRWEGSTFEMKDPSGRLVPVQLIAGCPTVDEQAGLNLIREIELAILMEKTRIAVLKGGDCGGAARKLLGASAVSWLERVSEIFSGVPMSILSRVVPKEGFEVERLPWNRHLRRKIDRAERIVVHLFSGPDTKTWGQLEDGKTAVICIDLELGSQFNLLNPHVASYIMELCASGRVEAIIAGPPCRTVSRMRMRAPGPPQLRARDGDARFGVSGLSEADRRLVEGDAVLFLQTMFFHLVATEARAGGDRKKVAFVMENPEDPEVYAPAQEGEEECPSFWNWPEWLEFSRRQGVCLVTFDQGPLGHLRRKPTGIATNLDDLVCRLDGVRGPGEVAGLPEELEERLKESKRWAAWAPRLKEAVVDAVRGFMCDGDPAVRRLSAEQWKAHLLSDHQPFRAECRTCLEAASRGRMHRRVTHPRAYTLSIDLGGPYEGGRDQVGSRQKYMVVGAYTLPVTKSGGRYLGIGGEDHGEGGGDGASGPEKDDEVQGHERDVAEPGPEAELVRCEGDAEAEPEEQDGLEIVAEKRRREPEEEGDDQKLWEDRIEYEEGTVVKQFTFVEVVASRHSSHVLPAIAKIYTRLRYLGMPVYRLHSDRAAELRSGALKKWCAERDIYRTFTDGDSYKMNGRAEAEVGYLSRATKALLVEAELPDSMWPLALRHAAERRLQLQLAEVKMPTQELLPFGSYGYARQKDWNEKTRAWRRSRVKVRILGPDATISSGGYYVQTEEGYFLHTTDVRLWKEREGDAGAKEMPHLGDLKEKGKDGPLEQDPRRRVHGKSPALIKKLVNSSEELERRFERGRRMMVEEALLREECCPDGRSDGGALLDTVIVENGRIEASLKQVQAVVTEAGFEACEEKGEWLQTVTIPNSEVRKELHLWKPALEKEYKSLLETGVIEVIQETDLRHLEQRSKDAGRIFEVVPGKAVCTRKSPDGRRKARGVICGNFMIPREKEDLYASGCDITAIRSMIRHAALQKWSLASVDVSTAFLQVPPGQKKDTTVVVPPRLFQEAELVAPGERWLVKGTLYGTITAPREWGDHRDETLRAMRWGDAEEWSLAATLEPHLWEIRRAGQVLGHAAIYVDDILTAGDDGTIRAFLEKLSSTWKCSAAEWVGDQPVKFCGLEISKEGDGFKIHQESYLRSLIAKHGVEKRSSQLRIEMPIEEDEKSLEVVRQAQAVTGELQWAASRTRPDIAYGCSVMAQYSTKAPQQVVAIGDEILRYLCGSVTAGISYGAEGDMGCQEGLPFRRERQTVEIHCDAAFAPAGGKSVTGVVAFYSGSPVFWCSARQTIMSLSTAEAELSAQLEALVVGRSIRSLLQCVEGKPMNGIILNDNAAALAISGGTSGSWRTRHLRIKAEGLTEAVRSGEWCLRHLDGRCLAADGLTKPLQGRALEKMLVGLRMSGEPSREPISVKRLGAGIEDAQRVSKLLAATVILGCCVKQVEGARGSEEYEGTWLAFLLVVMSLGYVLGEGIKRLGQTGLKMIFGGADDLKVKLLTASATVPSRGTRHSAGWDLASDEEVTVMPGENRVVSTGLAMEIPRGAYGRLTARSSHITRGIGIGPGVIDRDYRGEVKVVLMNGSAEPLKIAKGDRIAQLVVEKICEGGINVVSSLSETDRGAGGFGSTGLNGPALRRMTLGRVSGGDVGDVLGGKSHASDDLGGMSSGRVGDDLWRPRDGSLHEPVGMLSFSEVVEDTEGMTSECESAVYGGPCGSGTPDSSELEEGFESMHGGRGAFGQSSIGEANDVISGTVGGWRTPSGRVVHTNWVCPALQSGARSVAVRLCDSCFPGGSLWPPERFRCAAFGHGDVAHLCQDGCELSTGSIFRVCRLCSP